ncbi:AAA domain-containing protein [Pseudomassariella vexata]|uniref:AAA domain-domain-containing protein n=1 Tax=Pseudomassariella vexata TaxID=1141098 RepID=A0A1Y2DJU5_9PEZI|nr:AAA domain-containing protein [Pseudomassariella vexata]ORY59518.1 AAA domain-domain-containing protein [Pseudomassariella vexata]
MNLPNIYIIGAQCTGKTTLVNALEAYFTHQHHKNSVPTKPSYPAPSFIEEVARTVLKTHNFAAHDIRTSPSRALALQTLILEAQFRAERLHLATAEDNAEDSCSSPWFISDRSAIDPIVYALRYVSEDAAQELSASNEWKEMRALMARSLVIVCEAGANWLVDDGVRLMPSGEEWMETHRDFCQVLKSAGLKYEILPWRIGIMDERVKFVLSKWERLLTTQEKTLAKLAAA